MSDKSTRKMGNYTIVKTKDGDVVLVGDEGAITQEFKNKQEIRKHLCNVILPQVEKIINEGVEDIYNNTLNELKVNKEE